MFKSADFGPRVLALFVRKWDISKELLSTLLKRISAEACNCVAVPALAIPNPSNCVLEHGNGRVSDGLDFEYGSALCYGGNARDGNIIWGGRRDDGLGQ